MATAIEVPQYSDLTAIRRDVLGAVARVGPCNGQTLKHTLESAFGDDVNIGILYPALDALADSGLIEKRERKHDRRSNEYALTIEGRDELVSYHAWLGKSLEEE